ncbi:MAG: hypothetical protein AAGL49_05545 [Pseudomonadota bacterium]
MRPESVKTPEDLALYLSELAEEAEGRAKGWENNELGEYLGAIARWIEDRGDFRSKGLLRANIWRDLARMFATAKNYE